MINRVTIFRATLATAILGAGLALATTAAFAGSATQSTILTLTIPSTISLSGLAANYSQTAAAGATSVIDTGPLVVSTNNPLGYTLTLAAAAANFQGNIAADTFPVSADTISILACPANGDICSSRALSTTAGPILVRNSPAAGGDTFTVHHSVAVPAAAVPDSYAVTVSYVATTN